MGAFDYLVSKSSSNNTSSATPSSSYSNSLPTANSSFTSSVLTNLQNRASVAAPAPIFSDPVLSSLQRRSAGNIANTPAQSVSAFVDPYNPTQINSLLDVIMRSIDPSENNGNAFKTFIDSLNTYKNNMFVYPWQDNHNIKAIIMNLLQGAGETLDVLTIKPYLPVNWTTAKQYGNKVKTLAQGYNLWEVFKNRLQLASGYNLPGRYTFDMDVDLYGDPDKTRALEWVLNLGGEFASDILNWFSFGVKEVFTTALSKPKMLDASADILQSVATKVGFDVADDAAELITNTITKRLNKGLAKAFFDNDAKSVGAITDIIWENIRKYISVKNGDNFEELLKFINSDNAKTLFRESMQNALTKSSNAAIIKLSTNIAEGLRSLKRAYWPVKAMEAADKAITYIAWAPVSVAISAGKYAVKPAAKVMSQAIVLRNLKKYVNASYGATIDSYKMALDELVKSIDELKLSDVLDGSDMSKVASEVEEAAAELYGKSALLQAKYCNAIIQELHNEADVLKTAKESADLGMFEQVINKIDETLRVASNGKINGFEEYYAQLQAFLKEVDDGKVKFEFADLDRLRTKFNALHEIYEGYRKAGELDAFVDSFGDIKIARVWHPWNDDYGYTGGNWQDALDSYVGRGIDYINQDSPMARLMFSLLGNPADTKAPPGLREVIRVGRETKTIKIIDGKAIFTSDNTNVLKNKFIKMNEYFEAQIQAINHALDSLAETVERYGVPYDAPALKKIKGKYAFEFYFRYAFGMPGKDIPSDTLLDVTKKWWSFDSDAMRNSATRKFAVGKLLEFAKDFDKDLSFFTHEVKKAKTGCSRQVAQYASFLAKGDVNGAMHIVKALADSEWGYSVKALPTKELKILRNKIKTALDTAIKDAKLNIDSLQSSLAEATLSEGILGKQKGLLDKLQKDLNDTLSKYFAKDFDLDSLSAQDDLIAELETVLDNAFNELDEISGEITLVAKRAEFSDIHNLPRYSRASDNKYFDWDTWLKTEGPLKDYPEYDDWSAWLKRDHSSKKVSDNDLEEAILKKSRELEAEGYAVKEPTIDELKANGVSAPSEEQEMLNSIRGILRDLQAEVESFEGKLLKDMSFGEDNNIPIVQMFASRVKSTQHMLYGNAANLLTSILDPENKTITQLFDIKQIEEISKSMPVIGQSMSDIFKDADVIMRHRDAMSHLTDLLRFSNRKDWGRTYLTAMNVLENHFNVNASKFADPKFQYEFIQQMQSKLNMSYAKQKVSLDSFRSRIRLGEYKEFDKVFETLGLSPEKSAKIFDMAMQGHDAVNDSIMLELIIRSELPEEAAQLDTLAKRGAPVYLFDLETAGLNPNTDTILQIGCYKWGGLSEYGVNSSNLKVNYFPEEFDEFARTHTIPTTPVLLEFFGNEKNLKGAELDEYLLGRFKEHYFSAKSIEEHFTEADILNKFKDITENNTHNYTNLFVGMNNTGFDNRFLRVRSATLADELGSGFSLGITQNNSRDIFALLNSKYGCVTLDEASQEIIVKWLNYISECLDPGEALGNLNYSKICQDARDLYKNIEKFGKSEDVAKELNTEYFLSLQTFAKDLRDAVSNDARALDSDLFRSNARGIVNGVNKTWTERVYIKDVFKMPITDETRASDWFKAAIAAGAKEEDLMAEQGMRILYTLRKNIFPDKVLDDYQEFKKALLESVGRNELTSLQGLFNRRGLSVLNSDIGYRYIARPDAQLGFFDLDKVPNLASTRFKITRKTDIISQMADRINNLGAAVGEHGLIFKNEDELDKALRDAINLAREHVGDSVNNRYWWAALNPDKLTAPKLKYAAWAVIQDDPAYKAIASSAWKHSDRARVFEKAAEATKAATDGLDPSDKVRFTSAEAVEYATQEAVTAADILEETARVCDMRSSDSYAVKAITQNLRRLVRQVRGLDIEQQSAFYSALAKCKNELNRAIAANFFDKVTELTPDGTLTKAAKDYFTEYLLFESPVVIFDTNDFVVKYFVGRHLNELDEAGIKLISLNDGDKNASKIMFYLDKSRGLSFDFTEGTARFNGTNYTKTANFDGVARVRKKGDFIECPVPAEYKGNAAVEYAVNLINESRKKLYDLNNAVDVPVNGRDFSELSYRNLFGKYSVFKNGTELPEDLITPEELANRGFFEGVHYNKAYIGCADILDESNMEDVLNKNILDDTLNAIRHTAYNIKDRLLYTDLYFNKAYGMHFDADGIFKEVFDAHPGDPDGAYREIVNAFKNSDGTFVAATLIKDNSPQGYRAVLLPIDTVGELKQAVRLNATILPYDIYSKSFDAINNNALAQTWLTNAARRTTYLYKVGYLCWFGTWMRNAMDSPFKTMIDTGEPVETIHYVLKAMKDSYNFEKILSQMKKYEDGRLGKSILRTYSGRKRWFQRIVGSGKELPLSFDEFEKLWGFFEDGPSAGETKTLKQMVTSKGATKLSEKVANGTHYIVDKMLFPMSYVERIARLGQFYQLDSLGYTKTQIFKHISETQFDYSMKTKADRIIEGVIPFYSFMKMNFDFWLDAVCEKPNVARILDDIMKTQRNSYNATPEEVASNRSMWYHMSHGNLMVDPDTQLVLKLNPSYMDAFNLLLEPINAAAAIKEGQRRYSTNYALQQYLENSTVFGSVFAPLQNLISNAVDEYTIREKVTTMPMGKYYGLPVEEALKDTKYIQMLMGLETDSGKPLLKEYYPALWKLIMEHLDGTERLMPWGAHAGDTVRQLMQDNPEYCQYLMSQDWFKTEYKELYDIFVYNGMNEEIIMPFGKYKGTPITEVPERYLNYIGKQDWIQDWPLVYQYLTTGQTTPVLPEQALTETYLSQEELLGMYAYGETLDELESQDYFKDVFMKTVKDTSSWPVFGAVFQKYLGKESSAKNNYERLINANKAQRVIATAMPGTFGVVKKYEERKDMEGDAVTKASDTFYSSSDTSSSVPATDVRAKDTYSNARRYYSPARSYNYYRPQGYNRYKYNRGFRKYLSATGDLLRLKLGVSKLHIA